ncbi:MAG: glutamate-5-semialdehyde dehydrogenase [Christensenellales bacterium]
MDVRSVCERTKRAANGFMTVGSDVKNDLLKAIKNAVLSDAENLKRINAADVEEGIKNGLGSAFVDRLTLTDARIKTMCDGIDDVIALPDYVGKIEDSYTLGNGLRVEKVHAPLGVVGIIYESRPNVTVDAAILCIKSGNGVVLKGGKEAINTNRRLAELMRAAFVECGVNSDLIGFIDSTDREKTLELLHSGDFIDVMIPRGGEKLKKLVLKEATMPVIASSGGNCHVYVEKTASVDMALKIVENAKISRPSVCNAAETLLVDREIADSFLPVCLKMLEEKGVEIRGTEEVSAVYPNTKIVNDDEFYTEYNDMIIKVKVVSGLDEAVEHINRYGTNHSEAIVTEDERKARVFTAAVDAGCVYVNASTRFTDGFELGLGAEMGISTQKLHVRGPIGLKELTSVKYVVRGNGQVR